MRRREGDEEEMRSGVERRVERGGEGWGGGGGKEWCESVKWEETCGDILSLHTARRKHTKAIHTSNTLLYIKTLYSLYIIPLVVVICFLLSSLFAPFSLSSLLSFTF